MDSTDADMMEVQSSSPSQPQPQPAPPPQQFLASNTEEDDDVRGLITLARQLIDQGKPSQALQTVVVAMRTKGGDGAVFEALNRAQELYRNKLQASAAADELASLFAECAIAEAMPSEGEQNQYNTVAQSIGPDAHGTSMFQFIEPDAQGNSILAETGRQQIVLNAFSDGSSFVCLKCGGLVSNHRKEEHYGFWCCKI
ncbi:unnamed protein product [Ilex paraguariensis]|uniref:C2HC zinc finger plants domain-containing protein n=1 Tax=Ilex paraguariensis TaxID=185542 RepID=A0ABC8U5M8_9AQUA